VHLHGTSEPSKRLNNQIALLNLRITCRQFNDLVTPILFDSIHVAFVAYDLYHFDNAIPPTKFTEIISNKSNLKRNVMMLFLDFYDLCFNSYAPNYHEQKYMHRAIVGVTPKVICSVPKLEKLRIKVTEDAPIQSVFWGGRAKSLPLSEIEVFVHGLANAFASPQISPLLTTLQLQLFCTYDFEVIAETASAASLQNSTSLYIEIADSTGPRGSHEYDSTYGSHEDYELDTLFSNVQSRYLSVKNQQGVFDLIAQCPQLKSLGLVAAHHLDLNLLDWERKVSTLQVLYLRRMRASESKLLRLLSPGLLQVRESFALSSVQLVQVELKDGLWQNITEHRATLESLSGYLRLCMGTYTSRVYKVAFDLCRSIRLRSIEAASA
jgi:hypothetical protein